MSTNFQNKVTALVGRGAQKQNAQRFARNVEKAYAYDHDAEDAFSGQNYFPDGMKRPVLYAPVERGFERELKKRVEEMTAKLPSQERPKDTQVLNEEFTMDNGLLTPTLKVRRREVEARFKALVDEMYARLDRRRG